MATTPCLANNSSSTSDILSSSKDGHNVLSVVKVAKVAKVPGHKNKRSTNRMVLYLVDKDTKEGGSKDITHQISTDTTCRKSIGHYDVHSESIDKTEFKNANLRLKHSLASNTKSFKKKISA